ncbi:RecQ family ATP-dependent DNA helicase [Actinokineospora iranica]|uniref:ATP-dependent DNA helicase RecQ n=1 Tax=Actinokineospora iranica TaxID=1271860 RepID=A0A1G6XEX1_9PSEU|nr:RecQ family ATP-dependent DNA helicase [Actinokineospora iranica]SDD76749.1 ATP-dependent DNA helicase RecQ [Actinokineospora iranica]
MTRGHSEVRDRIERAARDAFGWSSLRPEQIEAIDRLVAGDDVLVVLPTGAGKSAVYQVATLLRDGPTVVVSPLIALQHDQVLVLDDSAAPDAVEVNSAQRAGAAADAWAAVESGRAAYVFLAPEQLVSDETVERVAAARPGLVVVDEAHCVSDWGHDFRPDYRALAGVIRRLGRPPVAALTATASEPVRRDIVERLGLRDPAVLVTGFDRPNLWLAARGFGAAADRADAVVEHVRAAEAPGLLYVPTRKAAHEYADRLTAAGLSAAAFHAGMKAADKRAVHEGFLDGDVAVVVATSAFGMGIDKPDVRSVTHAACTDSLDSYYQQIGRAGRDGGPAAATLFHRPEDLSLQRFLSVRGIDEQAARAVADLLGSGPRTAAEVAAETGCSRRKATSLLNLFDQAGVCAADGDGVRLTADADRAHAAVVDLARRQREFGNTRLAMMREYAETRDCRRRLLLGYFGDVNADPCGHCDRCAEGAATPAAAVAESAGGIPPNTRVEHTEWGAGVVLDARPDRVTVLFDQHGYRTLSLAAVEENDLLRTVDAEPGQRGVPP